MTSECVGSVLAWLALTENSGIANLRMDGLAGSSSTPATVTCLPKVIIKLNMASG